MSLPTDHSKIAAKMVFNHHSDPGHGWVAVKKDLVRELGIIEQITRCSYMQGQSAYLEEDCDAGTFIKAFEARFGVKPQLKTLEPRNSSSPIRSMKTFKMEV